MPAFTSIFSLNTDSLEKLYKELKIVLYHSVSKHLDLSPTAFFNTLLGILIPLSENTFSFFILLETSDSHMVVNLP